MSAAERTPAWRYQLTSAVVEALVLLIRGASIAVHWVSARGYTGLDRAEYLASYNRAFQLGRAAGASLHKTDNPGGGNGT